MANHYLQPTYSNGTRFLKDSPVYLSQNIGEPFFEGKVDRSLTVLPNYQPPASANRAGNYRSDRFDDDDSDDLRSPEILRASQKKSRLPYGKQIYEDSDDVEEPEILHASEKNSWLPDQRRKNDEDFIGDPEILRSMPKGKVLFESKTRQVISGGNEVPTQTVQETRNEFKNDADTRSTQIRAAQSTPAGPRKEPSQPAPLASNTWNFGEAGKGEVKDTRDRVTIIDAQKGTVKHLGGTYDSDMQNRRALNYYGDQGLPYDYALGERSEKMLREKAAIDKMNAYFDETTYLNKLDRQLIDEIKLKKERFLQEREGRRLRNLAMFSEIEKVVLVEKCKELLERNNYLEDLVDRLARDNRELREKSVRIVQQIDRFDNSRPQNLGFVKEQEIKNIGYDTEELLKKRFEAEEAKHMYTQKMESYKETIEQLTKEKRDLEQMNRGLQSQIEHQMPILVPVFTQPVQEDPIIKQVAIPVADPMASMINAQQNQPPLLASTQSSNLNMSRSMTHQLRVTTFNAKDEFS